MDEKQTKAIQTYFAKEPVAAVYLFGSQATGRARPNSDIDFGILFSNKLSDEERFDKKLDYIGELSKIMHSDDIDVVDINDTSVELAFRVVRDGKAIVSNNKAAQIVFKVDVARNYYDRLYYIKNRTERGFASLRKRYGIA